MMPDSDRVQDALRDTAMAARDWATTFRGKAILTSVSGGVGVLAVLWVFWTYVYGPLDTVLYVFALIFGLTLIPGAILLLGNALPGNGLLGRLHIVFAHIALRYPYLLDRGDRFEYAAGTEEQVWIEADDGTAEYYPIESGHSNRTVLGWRPFGIVLDKTQVDLAEKRIDTAASRDRPTDGGQIERGGFKEVSPQPVESGIDGTWIVDLKRVFSRGVRKIGDTEILETTEEVTQRNQSREGKLSGWRSVIGSLLGMVLGASMAWAMFGGV